MVISWEQIKAALDMLINLCVSSPVTSSTGGKAYYSVTNPGTLGSRRIKKRTDPDPVSGKLMIPIPFEKKTLVILNGVDLLVSWITTYNSTRCPTATCKHDPISTGETHFSEAELVNAEQIYDFLILSFLHQVPI